MSLVSIPGPYRYIRLGNKKQSGTFLFITHVEISSGPVHTGKASINHQSSIINQQQHVQYIQYDTADLYIDSGIIGGKMGKGRGGAAGHGVWCVTHVTCMTLRRRVE